MTGPASEIRRVLGYLVNHSPEIVFIGGIANALVIVVLCLEPAWRSWPVFLAWAGLYCAGVAIAHVQSAAEIVRGEERKPWRTLIALQLAVIALTWVALK